MSYKKWDWKTWISDMLLYIKICIELLTTLSNGLRTGLTTWIPEILAFSASHPLSNNLKVGLAAWIHELPEQCINKGTLSNNTDRSLPHSSYTLNMKACKIPPTPRHPLLHGNCHYYCYFSYHGYDYYYYYCYCYCCCNYHYCFYHSMSVILALLLS